MEVLSPPLPPRLPNPQQQLLLLKLLPQLQLPPKLSPLHMQLVTEAEPSTQAAAVAAAVAT
jgi:hypothetical protein